ncbi:hypothetical protein [Priestia megaterium]|uniref:Uncharacterized protein n=1 Tax=Priestia megaterium TaxID=1404 RepID=A0A6M6E0H9_PRIMG|nr:hypothetical protein [Priestia megaterium]QJX80340.1 hypothetical protein FDZ14_30085 [Priestia megaterium]
MEVEVCFMSQKTISNMSKSGVDFPFVIEGSVTNVVEFLFDTADPYQFVPKWMVNINKFPIYVYVEIFEFQKDEFEQVCIAHNIKHETLNIKNKRDGAYKATVKDNQAFNAIFPYLHSTGSINNVALWSLEKDVFSLEKREFKTFFGKRKLHTPVASLEDDSSVFWIGFDSQHITAISNNKLFSSVDQISNHFPLAISILSAGDEEEIRN